jgi:hypothetical protein
VLTDLFYAVKMKTMRGNDKHDDTQDADCVRERWVDSHDRDDKIQVGSGFTKTEIDVT